MKNLQFFPFERNRYYYGKLMTDQDLTSEQKYMNDKRRLINRLLHGCGVAAGLQVVSLDDRTVSVEAGMALDDAGREIVLEAPRVLMLDQIDGFQDLETGADVPPAYLCISYQEEGIYPARSADLSREDDSGSFEKYREGAEIYLTSVPPETGRDVIASLTTQTAVLFENSDLSVSCRFPVFAAAGEVFEGIFRIEAKRALPQVSVSFSCSLSALSWNGKENMDLEWNGSFREAGEAVELKEKLSAYTLENGVAGFTARRRNMKVTLAGQEYFPSEDIGGQIRISSKDAYRQMTEAWYAGAMEEVRKPGKQGGICLARLYLVRVGEELRIDRVEQLPFEQRVYNAFLNRGLLEKLIGEVDELKTEERGKSDKPVREAAQGALPRTAAGICEIPLGLGGKTGERFFSREIVHGLGLGHLKVSLSLVEDEYQYIGSSEIFEEMKLRAELAARVNSERGSFVIGARLLEASPVETIRVRWAAELLPEHREQGSEKRIRIVPDKPELRCMQNRYFRAETENLQGSVILWEVGSPDGGSITRDGLYTAPDTQGIYEVRAFCQEDPKIRSSVFVIVR